MNVMDLSEAFVFLSYTLIRPNPVKMTPHAREEQKGEKRCMMIQTTTNRHGEKHNLFQSAFVVL